MNFKKTMLASLLMISASGAFAVETGNLTVKGTISPSSCDVVLTDGDIVIADVEREELRDNETTTLPSHTVGYTIDCDATAAVKHVWADEQAGTSTGLANTFGLGLQGAEKIGGYTVELSQSPQDSSLGQLANLYNVNGSWSGMAFRTITPTVLYSYSTGSSVVPAAVERVTGELTVTPFIGPAANLDFEDGLVLDGKSVMTVSYL